MSDDASPLSLRFRQIEMSDKPGLPLPSALQNVSRGGTVEREPLLDGIQVSKTYVLGATTRSGAAATETALPPDAPELLAIETADGNTLFIRSDKLAADIARLRPEAVVDGQVELERFRDPNAVTRGFGDVLWKAVSVLKLPSDGLAEQAEALAAEWLREKLGDAALDTATRPVVSTASAIGVKALMWVIESSLAGRSGVYQWREKTVSAADRCQPNDERFAAMAQGKPALLLIHGTASYTVGSFADLRDDESTWRGLQRQFPGGVFGFEHRTFSESPIENALALIEQLPAGARLSLVTHSRGGLVGDVLSLGTVDEQALAAYGMGFGDDDAGLRAEFAEEQQRLRNVIALRETKDIRVQRYVRVACPARGTRFLSDNLDAALSDFLSLLQWGGSAAIRATATALGGPAAGEAFGRGTSSALGVVKRLVLEIAARRVDPRMVPGLAAMRIDSPLGGFLVHPGTRRQEALAMAVIAGDTEFEGFGVNNLGRRVANLFCDWRLFDQQNNDLVVDTDSMFAGLAVRDGARYLYDQDASVTHFRYFKNAPTRDALSSWLTTENPDQIATFAPLGGGAPLSWRERDARATVRGGRPSGPKPVAIVIPGIMGSHIEVRRTPNDAAGSGDRIWFDALSLAAGKLDRIGDPTSTKIFAEDIWERFYGDLADYLGQSHEVLRCPYDWRLTPRVCAAELVERVNEAARKFPGQPIRLLAHSMGGLVARALIRHYPSVWQSVLASGGSLVMLGTPNHGAHLMVHTLMGKTDSMRMLEKIDFTRGLQEVVDIVRGFPGALALLPKPGFRDVGAEPRIDASKYYEQPTWKDLQARNTDRWYPDKVCGVPDQLQLDAIAQSWSELGETVPNVDRIAYVFGQAKQTPCGVQIAAGGNLNLLFTADGDGSVTWASGDLPELTAAGRCWYMPAGHGDLTNVSEYFPAIADLLSNGSTDKLGRLPRVRDAVSRVFSLEAAPPVVPTEDELARAFVGAGAPRRKRSRDKLALQVSVRAGDLRFLDQPLICGHYIGDMISGAEAALDDMLDGRLSERDRLGVYAAGVGTSAIVLAPRSEEESRRGSHRGAVIVGLGDFNGQLSTRQVTETVRSAVLRYLLLLRDSMAETDERPVRLYSLLLGYNSNAHISIGESVTAVTRGVLEANRDLSAVLQKSRVAGRPVAHLCFVEVYRDAAITAAREVRETPQALRNELAPMGATLTPEDVLQSGEGVRDRLSADSDQGHWARFIVTDAAAGEDGNVLLPPGRPANLATGAATAAVTPPGADATPLEQRYYPERLKYVVLSQRARAESVVLQRQPGLIEAIIRDQRRNPTYDATLGRTLFQLMVPLDFKAVAREQARFSMVLDGYTANLPWEMLQADEKPLALTTRMIRQLASTEFRRNIRTANVNSACIIAPPSTDGFDRRFGGEQQSLAPLPEGAREAEAIRATLRRAGWNESDLVFSAPDRPAVDVLAKLYERPYRVMTIAAHGVFEATGKDQRKYTGVVLSDGLLLTAVEIGLMEVVPEVVLLSCCHLGSVNNGFSDPNRMAYSIARELIEMGVRCVVAAGWAVNDEAACTFASVLFEEMTAGCPYGEAVFKARCKTYEDHRHSNTWGAYQAYGDPGFRLTPEAAASHDHDERYVAVEELLADLRWRIEREKRLRNSGGGTSLERVQRWLEGTLKRCPPSWAERPDVLQAIAELLAGQGQAGFELARRHYELALQRHDDVGRVAVNSIGELANLEARHGEKLAAAGAAEQGLKLIDRAIRRLVQLREAAAGESIEHSEVNRERAALLGSARKRRAVVLAQMGKDWAELRETLIDAASAYESGVRGDAAQDPYVTLNALGLRWLAGLVVDAGTNNDAIALTHGCAEAARQRFAKSQSFWDAVMSADAAVLAWLLGEPLDEPVKQLHRIYEEAVLVVPLSGREWDSVVSQWRLYADLLRARGDRDGLTRADVLERLSDVLAGSSRRAVALPVDGSDSTAQRRRAGGRSSKAAPVKRKKATSRKSAPRGKKE